MNIYEATLKAADYIECHPRSFDFIQTAMPSPKETLGFFCGTPGCALGWISHFMGLPKYTSCEAALGVSEWSFYGRMDALDWHWDEKAKNCATALRAYASKYLAPPAPKYDFEALAARLAREPLALTHVRERVA